MLCGSKGSVPRREDKKLHMEGTQGSKNGTRISDSQAQNETIRWLSDNQNVISILMVGSKNPSLQEEALAVFSMAACNLIRIEPEWIPRKYNEQAYYLSHIQDKDDWAVDTRLFQMLNQLWGPYNIDRFADHVNTRLLRFNSRYWCPGTEAVDVFTCNWGKDLNWICPSLYLVPRVLCHAEKTHAAGTLIVPVWRSAPFWPIIYPDGIHPAKFITETKTFGKPIVTGLSGQAFPACDILAMCFRFTST